MRILIFVLVWFAFAGGTARADGPSLALSFDDGLDPRQQPRARAWNEAILSALEKAKLKSILFAAGSRVDSDEGIELVRQWGEKGHAIGNHTYSHRSFGSAKTSLESFVADIEKNEALLKPLPGWVRRFRFPYLKEGETVEKRDGLRRWLSGHGYESGAVSIDASDWYYNQRYLAWKSAHADAASAPFRDAYLQHLWSRASYYDGVAQQILQRKVRHVLLLHTNAINADFLPDVITMFESHHWSVIDAGEAFADPLYREQPAGVPAGESLIWALAKQAGFDNLRYPAEDEVYEKPILDALGL